VGGGEFEYLNVVFDVQSSSALAVGQSIAVALIGPCSPQGLQQFPTRISSFSLHTHTGTLYCGILAGLRADLYASDTLLCVAERKSGRRSWICGGIC
jgi:hypothetical protein